MSRKTTIIGTCEEQNKVPTQNIAQRPYKAVKETIVIQYIIYINASQQYVARPVHATHIQFHHQFKSLQPTFFFYNREQEVDYTLKYLLSLVSVIR